MKHILILVAVFVSLHSCKPAYDEHGKEVDLSKVKIMFVKDVRYFKDFDRFMLKGIDEILFNNLTYPLFRISYKDNKIKKIELCADSSSSATIGYLYYNILKDSTPVLIKYNPKYKDGALQKQVQTTYFTDSVIVSYYSNKYYSGDTLTWFTSMIEVERKEKILQYIFPRYLYYFQPSITYNEVIKQNKMERMYETKYAISNGIYSEYVTSYTPNTPIDEIIYEERCLQVNGCSEYLIKYGLWGGTAAKEIDCH